jgi:excinuclease ABC subunit C
MGAFLQQFYTAAFTVPASVIVNVMPDDSDVIQKWLTGKRNGKAEITKPERGRKKQLLEMALENAKLKLESFSSSEEARKEALAAIKNIVGMENWPGVMEAIDISNISGVSAVGSLVTFRNGEPDKKAYKRYSITVSGIDDYAMTSEVVERRFRRLRDEGKQFPDLLVIDGGPGQLSAAMKKVFKYNPGQTVISIAKGKDRERSETDLFYKAGEKSPLPFPPSSAGRFLLQRLRDESHRFAINYHRKTRSKAAFRSEVDSVKGFGPKRKKLLVKEFGSLKGAKSASVKEIAEALSVNDRLAGEILEKL